MSCIAGVVQLDGAPADRGLLLRMADVMKPRAPDAQDVWCSGAVGLAHDMLRISPRSQRESQPLTLDQQVWITADARIDGRKEFIGEIRRAGRQVATDATDPELLLHAYLAFGESMLDRLIGDFAFALWDARQQKLLCVRDHFGVRPLCYGVAGNAFVFASEVDAVLEHPAMKTELDESAAADFLFFGTYQSPDATIYRSVRVLPPATILTVRGGRTSQRHYWRLPSHEAIRYRDDREYVEHFRSVFEQAVKDRIETDHVAVELSGGMDSTSIAAVTAKAARAAGRSVTAYTRSAIALLPHDEEAGYATRVAAYLGIPSVVFDQHSHQLFHRAGAPELRTAEPHSFAFLASTQYHYSRILAAGSRVVLSGHGGDALFDNSNHYFMRLLRTGRLDKLLVETCRHVAETGSIRGMGWWAAVTKGRGHERWRPAFPTWLATDFLRRGRLAQRWDSVWRGMQGGSGSFHQLRQPWLGRVFAMHEPLNLPLVVRYPFYDLRLVRFTLALPNVTKRDKLVLRQAMAGELPAEVLKRPKTGLAGDVTIATLRRSAPANLVKLAELAVGLEFIEHARYIAALQTAARGESMDAWTSNMLMAPAALSTWLANYSHRRDPDAN